MSRRSKLINTKKLVTEIIKNTVVVSERYFTNLACQAKLDEEYGTILISRLSELKPYLEQLDNQ